MHEMTDITYLNCSAGSAGGAMYFDSCSAVSLVTAIISHCSGPAVYASESSMHLNSTLIEQCHGRGNAGAIYAVDTLLWISCCEFIDNMASVAGAICMEGMSSGAELTNSTFARNSGRWSTYTATPWFWNCQPGYWMPVSSIVSNVIFTGCGLVSLLFEPVRSQARACSL